MKVGLRTPSLKKSIKARTTGKYKRKLKKMANPFYGKKGIGWIKDPSRALKNKVYHKTTISAKSAIKKSSNFFVTFLYYCFVWPMKWIFIIMLEIMKWMAIGIYLLFRLIIMGLVWLFVNAYNGVISLIEKSRETEEDTEYCEDSENAEIDKDGVNSIVTVASEEEKSGE